MASGTVATFSVAFVAVAANADDRSTELAAAFRDICLNTQAGMAAVTAKALALKGESTLDRKRAGDAKEITVERIWSVRGKDGTFELSESSLSLGDGSKPSLTCTIRGKDAEHDGLLAAVIAAGLSQPSERHPAIGPAPAWAAWSIKSGPWTGSVVLTGGMATYPGAKVSFLPR